MGEEVQRLVEGGREFKQAVAEVFAANAQRLALCGNRRAVKGPRHVACASMWRSVCA